MKPAAAYIRVSGVTQLDGDGPDRQNDTILAFARRAKYRVDQSFIEDISGTTDSTERPKFAAMLDYCRQNGIGAVIIERMDRLARDLIVGELLLQECRQSGIDVIDAATGQNLTEESDDPTVTLVRQMMLAVSQYEKCTIVMRMRKARERIRSNGRKCEGRKGYADTEAGRSAIRRAEALRKAGKSYRTIAKTLQQEGYQTASGGPWKAGTVHGMLG